MPIWLHLALTAVCCVVGALAVGAVGAVTGVLATLGLARVGVPACLVHFLLGIPLFFGGAAAGVHFGRAFAVRCLPARCPNCAGRTLYRSGQPISYHCPSCGHVHTTGVSGG
jgi:hypothetical protein